MDRNSGLNDRSEVLFLHAPRADALFKDRKPLKADARVLQAMAGLGSVSSLMGSS
jgi:hypothetical protein